MFLTDDLFSVSYFVMASTSIVIPPPIPPMPYSLLIHFGFSHNLVSVRVSGNPCVKGARSVLVRACMRVRISVCVDRFND